MEVESVKVDDELISDKVLIEIEESQGRENNHFDNSVDVSLPVNGEDGINKLNLDTKEGREVKPKKIPIGGIQMPGFFQRKSLQKPDYDSAQFETISLKNDKDSASATNTSNTNTINSRSFRSLNPIKVLPSIDAIKSLRFPFFKPATNSDVLTDDKQLVKQKIIDLASAETLNDESPAVALNKLDSSSSAEKPPNNGNSIPFLASICTACSRLKPYRTPISTVIIFMVICMLLVKLSYINRRKQTPPIYGKETVQTLTTCGIVEGIREYSAISFRGIPYAVPPIGKNRWRNAQPFNSLKYCWNDTLIAYNNTDTALKCWQIDGTSIDGAEDCLTLDVVTPYVRNDNLVPVIVMIGADTLIGPSPVKARPSARYARSRDVIFVRPNFRLGVLGFLSIDALTEKERPPTSGNYGLTDVIQALNWVQLNIRNFGGDPDRVTLLGYKAGASMVLTLAFSEHSHLFHQIWAFSGSALMSKMTLEHANIQNERFAEDHNCSDVNNVYDCLYNLDSEELIELTPDDWRKPSMYTLPALQAKDEYQHHWLIHDGGVIKTESHVNSKKLKIVLGTTSHAAYSNQLKDLYAEWNSTQVKEYVENSMIGFMNLTDAVFEQYPVTFHGLLEMITDIRIACPLYDLKTHLRKDGYDIIFYKVKTVRNQDKISDIDSDIDAILGRYEPKTAEQRRYFASMQQLFYHFVSHNVFKKPYDPKEPYTQYLEIEQDLISVANYSRCDFWRSHNILPKYAQLE